jgi:RNA polymerase sigma-70 factor (ECF subfamily)
MIPGTTVSIAPTSLKPVEGMALMAMVARGDSRAVSEFYRSHASFLYRFITRHALDACPEDLEELLQDTMLSAVTAAARFRGDCNVRTWLCGIALRQIQQRRRTEARHKRIPAGQTIPLDENVLDGLKMASVEGQVVPADIAESLAMQETVRQILAGMGETNRTVLLMRYVDGLTISEIAAALNRTERSVEGLLRRARQQAREIGEQYL